MLTGPDSDSRINFTTKCMSARVPRVARIIQSGGRQESLKRISGRLPHNNGSQHTRSESSHLSPDSMLHERVPNF